MFAIVPLLPLLAIPGAAKFVEIAVVALLLLFILWLIQQPLVSFPAPFKQIAVWVVAGALILFLVWEALTIAGIL